jgi:hypothetical protein
MKALKERLAELRKRLSEVNLGETLQRVRERRERRLETRKQRRELRERRDNAEERYRKLLDEGADPESDRMVKLAEEIAELRDRVKHLHRRLTAIGEALKRLVRRADKKRGQKTKLEAAITRVKQAIEDWDPPGDEPGTGPWGGSQSVGEVVVVRVAGQFNVWISSRKRSPSDPLTLANPGSDHNEAITTAYAWDIATFDGAPVAHAIANALGISGYTTGNYNPYYIYRSGLRFRVQILWAVSGHYNHVHVGIKRA